MENIRNFSIIAHIDHGKSTLADRMLEFTNTIPKRKMKDRVLDQMELEKERGITIKMQPVRMSATFDGSEYVLNMIDTPGHIDFAYEVSRSLRAVEGVILLVDATQGVQAQTLSVLNYAKEFGLVVIPALSKVDSSKARIEEVKKEIFEILGTSEVIETSGRTGVGVEELLKEIIKLIPPPKETKDQTKALVFDFSYSSHEGVIAFVRVFDGEIKKGDEMYLLSQKEKFSVKEVGIFRPDRKEVDCIKEGEIGYISTGIKKAGIGIVGDTIARTVKTEPLEGYLKPKPVVWASIFPQNAEELGALQDILNSLSLSDSSLSFEEETSLQLGKGYRCGFLGMLHLEIVTERIKREAELDIVITSPTTDFRVVKKNGDEIEICNPANLPDRNEIESIYEPWIRAEIITPKEYLNTLIQVIFEHEGIVIETKNVSERLSISVELPIREFSRGFFDKVKSSSSGYASVSYERIGERPADVIKLDVLIAEEIFPIFSKIVSAKKVSVEAKKLVETLYKNIPRQMFQIKIQVAMGGKILAARKLSALRKDVTAKLYGGDITRKMKLREKQKKGKAKMKTAGKVNIPHNTFLKIVKEN